jgi:hypothetical protein
VIAISGKFVAMASMMTPPNAAPRCHRRASTSVVWESLIPATQITAAHTTNIVNSTSDGNELTGAPLATTHKGVRRLRR